MSTTLERCEAAVLTCGVLITETGETCGDMPAWHYDGECFRGHDMSVLACDPCMAAALLGCATCWQEHHEVSPVTFVPAPCRCGCTAEVPLVGHTDHRWGRVRGRPGRYLPGHNPKSHKGKGDRQPLV